jgi:hypothetical protein
MGHRPSSDGEAGSPFGSESPSASGCSSSSASSRRPENMNLHDEGSVERAIGKAARRRHGFMAGNQVAFAISFFALLLGTASGQLSLFDVQGQFRGGSISWEPVDGAPNRVKFTVTTAWLRSAGTYVKVVNGVPQAQFGYQPVKGDVVKMLGFETPKFVTHGFERYLEVKVTFSTEQVGNRTNIGRGLPHTKDSESYWANNWFEGVSEFEVEYPRQDVMYVAEVHGCCRQNDMCRGDATCQQLMEQPASANANQNSRDGVGIKQFFNTPFFLSATVRLDMKPPPISFLPHFIPFSKTENDIEVGVLDFAATRQSASKRLVPQPEESWADTVIREQTEEFGSMLSAASVPSTGPTGGGPRRRLSNYEFQKSSMLSLDAYPPPPVPEPVVVFAGVTGTDVRQLQNPSMHVRLYNMTGCNSRDVIEVPPNMDVCEGSSATRFYPSGRGVANNFSSYLVPAGMLVEISDRCEFSRPPESYVKGFLSGTVVGTCDNREGTAPMCCNLNAGQRGVMVRATMKPRNVPSSMVAIGNQWIQINYRPQPDGRVRVSTTTRKICLWRTSHRH